MLLELMSNGTLAELPPDNMPQGIAMPDESSVMLLLPHNKYLLSTGRGDWLYASDRGNEQPRNVFLYEDQGLSLMNDGARPTVLAAPTVNALRKELLSLTDPPGQYFSTVMMLKTFMRAHEIFQEYNDRIHELDEKTFNEAMKKDSVLYRAYWALRFALARGEFEAAGRLKAWLKAGPEVFKNPKNVMKIWFSLTDLPDKDALKELEALHFSRLELEHMAIQSMSPIVVYNPLSGWLLLGKFGRKNSPIFISWSYLNHDLYNELKQEKKLSVHDIILGLWGEYETQQAITERAKYKGADELQA